MAAPKSAATSALTPVRRVNAGVRRGSAASGASQPEQPAHSHPRRRRHLVAMAVGGLAHDLGARRRDVDRRRELVELHRLASREQHALGNELAGVGTGDRRIDPDAADDAAGVDVHAGRVATSPPAPPPMTARSNSGFVMLDCSFDADDGTSGGARSAARARCDLTPVAREIERAERDEAAWRRRARSRIAPRAARAPRRHCRAFLHSSAARRAPSSATR